MTITRAPTVVENVVAAAERCASPARYLAELRAVGLLTEAEYTAALDRVAA